MRLLTSRRLRHALPPLVLAAAIGAATIATAASGSAGADTVFTAQGVSNQYQDFDLQQSTQQINAGLVSYAYDKLMARDASNKVVPYIGTPVKVSATSVTFKIRPNVKCADGQKLDSLGVLNSFKRLLEVPKKTDFVGTLFGKGPYHVHANVKRGLFTFATETPYRNLLAGFAHPGAGIICPAGLAAVASDPHALEKTTYGSGPYTVASYTPTVQLTYKLRKDWTWGPAGTTATKDAKGRPMPDEIVLKNYGNDASTLANLLLTGGIDYATISGPDLQRVLANKSLVHKTARDYTVYPLIYNGFPGRVTRDPKVRQALSYAFDCKQWLQAAWLGQGTCNPGVFPVGTDCYQASVVKKYAPTFDIKKAQQILQSDGYTLQNGVMTKNGQPLQINVLTGYTAAGPPGELLAGWYKQAGFDVELHNYTDGATYVRDLYAGNADVITESYTVLDPDTLDGGLLYHSGATLKAGGLNFGSVGGGDGNGNGDAQLEREKQLMFSTVGAESCKHMNNLQAIYLKNYYILGTVAPNFHYFANGWDFAATTWIQPWTIRKI